MFAHLEDQKLLIFKLFGKTWYDFNFLTQDT